MSNNKYVLYFHCTLFKDSSAGVVTVHKIIDYFNKNNQPAYIILQNDSIGAEGYKMPDYENGLDTPLLTEEKLNDHVKKKLIPIVFYPDTIFNNPLMSKNICRMIFYYDSIYTGKTSLGTAEKEGIMFFSKAIQERAAIKKTLYQDVVSFPVAKQEIFKYKDETCHMRKNKFYYDGKFSQNFSGKIPADIKNLDKLDRGNKNSMKQNDIFEKLKKAKILHVFEDTALIYEALLLGCPVNIHPDGYFYKNKPLAHNEVNLHGSISKRHPNEKDIEIALNEIINFKDEYEKWCNYGENKIKIFGRNFKYYKNNFDIEHIEKIRKNIKQSNNYIRDFKNENKSFLSLIKNRVLTLIIANIYWLYQTFVKTRFGNYFLRRQCLVIYGKLPVSIKKIITNSIANIKF